MDEPNSVVDWLDTKSLGSLKAVLHGFERFGGVPLPIGELARDPQRLPRAVRLRRIARELLVRQIGVVLDRAGRLDRVDPAGTFAERQLRPRVAASTVPVR